MKSGLDEINNLVEKEIEDVVDRNYSKAKDILEQNWNKVEEMVEALMKYETIDKSQIEKIMS